jgi:hypothetical protein
MSFINETILLFINVLHIIVILFVLCAPFSGSNYFLTMHIIIVPFILLHWVLNNNTCSLTVAEKFIREKTYGNPVKNDECFSYKFIAPIYDFNKNYEAYSTFSYLLTITLWSVSVYNISTKINNGNIKTFHDLCRL